MGNQKLGRRDFVNQFTERHHAFISAKFYQLLVEEVGEKGRQVFVLATQRYGEQRGSRMAQRAIRDGKDLTFQNYIAYGEWNFTEEAKKEIKNLHLEKEIEEESYSPDYRYHVFACPWSMQYLEMGLKEGAKLYCNHLDVSLARGFNPYLEFITQQTMHENGHCTFILKDAQINPEEFPQKSGERQKSFSYHCGHLYVTFSKIAKSILGEVGEQLSEKVLAAFEEKYGEEWKEEIHSYQNVDFDVL